MTRDGSVVCFWADGEHKFRLGIGELRELQEKTDCGPYVLYERLRTYAWRVDDVRETIRIGLIGAGMAPFKAHKLITRYFDELERPLVDHVPAALRIVGTALHGPLDEQPGKKTPAKAKRKPTRKEGSPLPGSTATAQS